ncbi:Oidioi.mRNA.OKI2018_I69.chr2.g6973.t2.cds [Oikopleura dioica]|uniref:Oidioi.mRNA.OKI2018_I69.chr2.g6973.t2.cds n=1 Tax=Oikopleura dioica TaxID=34765 RepID=A0ABN7TB94_OIKDI|nr:Oidioi.mRNA.OKI2018_I69.chr2.g6973.t2.cds [Oikopleura dioica]
MPYEVTISGGAPWGFRLSGGHPSPDGIKVNRVTPGGKAAAANVCVGDFLLAVNHQALQDASLLNVMELIKGSGDTVNLTLLTQEEYDMFKADAEAAAKAEEEAEVEAVDVAQAEAAPVQQTEPAGYESEIDPEYTLAGAQQAQAERVAIENPNYVDPGMTTDNEYNKTHQITRDEFANLPSYIQKAIRPQKKVPDYGKNVDWLHNKMKLKVTLPGGEAGKDAGTKLKTAALAYPNRAVEISGPVRGNIRHAQYNTPCVMYSDAQIANTLISQAAAMGADVPDPTTFGTQNVQVDTSTATYRAVKNEAKAHKTTQSKSFQLLDTLLKYPYLEENVNANNQLAAQLNQHPSDWKEADFGIKQLYDANWIICNPTTPANVMHVHRRQIALPFRKPLILMTPKSLLRLPEARSEWSEMDPGTQYRRLIGEEGAASKNPDNVKRLIFCSGKVYYDLVKERAARGFENDIAIARVEQVAPFPYDLVIPELEKYKNAEVYWVQEKHKNMGFYDFCKPRLRTASNWSRRVHYAGRDSAASAAAGSKQVHKIEQDKFMNDAFRKGAKGRLYK